MLQALGILPLALNSTLGQKFQNHFKILRYFEIQMFFIQSLRLGHVSPFDWKFLKNWNTKSQGPKKILPILQEGGSSPTHSTCNKGSFTPYRVGLSNPLISQLYTNVWFFRILKYKKLEFRINFPRKFSIIFKNLKMAGDIFCSSIPVWIGVRLSPGSKAIR